MNDNSVNSHSLESHWACTQWLTCEQTTAWCERPNAKTLIWILMSKQVFVQFVEINKMFESFYLTSIWKWYLNFFHYDEKCLSADHKWAQPWQLKQKAKYSRENLLMVVCIFCMSKWIFFKIIYYTSKLQFISISFMVISD